MPIIDRATGTAENHYLHCLSPILRIIFRLANLMGEQRKVFDILQGGGDGADGPDKGQVYTLYKCVDPTLLLASECDGAILVLRHGIHPAGQPMVITS